MIISRDRSYVFVHIPKTGGTSLAAALEARAMKDDLLIGDTPKARKRKSRLKGLQTRGRLWKHATLTDIDGLLTPEEIGQMFAFTLVRNPWDRVISYYHWLQDQEFDHPAVMLSKSLPFEEFLAAPLIQGSLQHSPASSYMRDATGAEHCSLYIRLEAFEKDAAPLMDHLGFQLSLPHLNPSRRVVDYRACYDARTRQIVAKLCAEDIARFGYRFDPDE
ncbi:sulfotransferase family 2 domain-containing protein [uncultured Roseobacter sp.]|uniref:sulfotransferase family 2 domain-containing protein n=1 Tax=uncultured Roseobacter sp. TaxID=114847 RepID=UPI002601C706|nr:sulfotransferase family 2 domain-containing protein [uncultured Roseobacter sp.]